MFFNYSCLADRVTCYSAEDPWNLTDVRGINRGVSVRYTVGNSVASEVRSGCDWLDINCVLPNLGSLPKISARFEFRFLEGQLCVTGSHSRFPSTEVYHDYGGQTHVVRQYSQIAGGVPALLVPDSRFGCEIA